MPNHGVPEPESSRRDLGKLIARGALEKFNDTPHGDGVQSRRVCPDKGYLRTGSCERGTSTGCRLAFFTFHAGGKRSVLFIDALAATPHAVPVRVAGGLCHRLTKVCETLDQNRTSLRSRPFH